jgi:hypothetical protein
MSKLKIFEGTENRSKSQELKEKIYPLLNGYTLKQIEDAFRFIQREIEEEYIINLSD